MDPYSPLPAIVSLGVALATSQALSRFSRATSTAERYASIDGLRGFLAFFVYLHHSSIWYSYLRTGRWEVPPSNLYTHFGQSAVALFFMITGFLFFSKIIEARLTKIVWFRLFLSRLLRLVPLYSLVVSLVFLTVFILSNGGLNEPLPKLLLGVIKWLAFTFVGAPDINGVERTWIIVAGVTWSLPYEWLFYFSLPILAFTVGVIPPFIYIGLAFFSITYAVYHPSTHYLSFIGGIAASLLVRVGVVRRLAVGGTGSIVLVASLVAIVSAFPSAYGVPQLFLLTAFFTLIASGNSVFGLLLTPAARTLGNFSYGIYLLHGIALFVTFNFALGLPQASELSVEQHWSVVVVLTPLLVFVSFLSFKFVEYPAMLKTACLTRWIRSIGDRLRVASRRHLGDG